MEPQSTTQVSETQKTPHSVNQITPVSKYLALALFILLPFVGGYLGYRLVGENRVEVFVPVLTLQSSTTPMSDMSPVHVAANGDLIPDRGQFNSVESAIASLVEPPSTDFEDGWTQDTHPWPRDMLYADGGFNIPKYSREDVRVKNTIDNCWIIYSNYVYDITKLLTLDYLFPAISELNGLCGSEVTEFIDSKPVEKGSLNTARFQYALANFQLDVVKE